MSNSPNDLFLKKGDFNGSPNIYQNKIMIGLRFRVYLDSLQLQDNVQWSYLSAGGFNILIAGFDIADDTSIIVQFY